MRNTLDLNPKFFSCRHIFLGRTHPLQIAASLLYWMMVKIFCDRPNISGPCWQFSLSRKNKQTTVVVEETVPIWVPRPYVVVNATSWCQLPPWSSPPGCPRRPQCCRPLTNNCRWGEDSSNLSISAQCCGEWAADCRKQYTDRLFTKTLVKEEHFFLRI